MRNFQIYITVPLNNYIDILIDTVSPTKAINSCTKVSSKNGNDNNKYYLCDSQFQQSSVKIEQTSPCIDIQAISK